MCKRQGDDPPPYISTAKAGSLKAISDKEFMVLNNTNQAVLFECFDSAQTFAHDEKSNTDNCMVFKKADLSRVRSVGGGCFCLIDHKGYLECAGDGDDIVYVANNLVGLGFDVYESVSDIYIDQCKCFVCSTRRTLDIIP